MKITMLGSFPPLRGISSYCMELAQAVARDSYPVEFLSFNALYPRWLYPGGDLEDDPTFPEVKNSALRIKRILSWYNPFSWLRAGLTNRGAVLHAQWWSLPLFPIYFCIGLLFRIRKIPIVFTVHNVLSHEQSTFFFLLSRLLFATGHFFIVHSTRNKAQLIERYGIDPGSIFQVPHGPLDLQVNPQADGESIRADLHLLPKHKVVLLFGAIRPYKGIETAIEAFAQVVGKLATARLLIVGKCWQSWQPYETLIHQHGLSQHVIPILGYVPTGAVHRYFCACDLVILPYRHFDSQSGVGAAAISFRKPMIVTNVGGLPDLVLDPGAVIPPGDANALAAAILACLDSPSRLKKMATDADTIAQMHAWPSIAQRTITIYEKLVKK